MKSTPYDKQQKSWHYRRARFSGYSSRIVGVVEEALEDTPVVWIHGPRQCGQTSLARMVGDAAGYDDIALDEDNPLAATTANPPHGAPEKRGEAE